MKINRCYLHVVTLLSVLHIASNLAIGAESLTALMITPAFDIAGRIMASDTEKQQRSYPNPALDRISRLSKCEQVRFDKLKAKEKTFRKDYEKALNLAKKCPSCNYNPNYPNYLPNFERCEARNVSCLRAAQLKNTLEYLQRGPYLC